MDEHTLNPANHPAPDWNASAAPDPRIEAEFHRRRQMLYRLRLLLFFGVAVFSLLILRLVRTDDPARLRASAPEPARVVREHLEALNRGQFREAYQFFSKHYRDKVSFEMYHELVLNHIEVFHTRLLALTARQNADDRTVLYTRLLAADGEHYIARFTVVRAGDRWWIDDVHWGTETDHERGIVRI